MPDTTLNLGSVQFQALEIPTEIGGIGGMQSLAVHRLVGGNRVVDAMGKDYPPLNWAGLFFGSTAVARMQALQSLLDSGAAQTLSWGAYNYSVIIREFTADYRRAYEIPYRISCEVVSDNSTRLDSSSLTTVDDAVDSDLSTAQGYAAQIGDPTLTSLMGILTTAIDAVGTFESAVPSVIASVLSPLASVQAQVLVLTNAADVTLGSVNGFGGVIVGPPATAMASSLEDAESAAIAEYTLLNTQGVCGRMAANVTSANGSPNVLAVAGSNLLQIAAQQYGDALDWTSIATANGLTDPFIPFPTTLTIPITPADSGGILTN